MSELPTASKMRLRHFAEMLDELANQAWPADNWLGKHDEVLKEFNALRGKAKQLLSLKDGESVWKETSPIILGPSSHLQQKQALESAIKRAAEILKRYAA